METLRALSILCNTLALGRSNETLCGRVYRLELSGSQTAALLRKGLDKVFFYEPEHCKMSHRGDLARALQVTRRTP